MWIIPNNYPLYSAFAQAMVVSNEDLSLPGLDIEQSLMWRSKPSQLKTWQRRWKTVYWMPRLCGRILKPSQRKSFETKLTLLLEAIHASPLVQRDNEKAKMTLGTCGHLSENISEQLDLLDASLKTSKATYRLDSQQSSVTWKRMVTQQRGEYSQRRKLAHRTEGSESLFWGSPAVNDANKTPRCEIHSKQAGLSRSVGRAEAGLSIKNESLSWPTPRASEYKDCGPVGSKSHAHMDKKSYLCAKAKDTNKPKGHLNPDWVEQLMGVPPGWTALDGTSNEWQYSWHDGSWEAGIPRVVESCDDRVDRIRLLGNGVVPATAAKAWITLGEVNGKG